MLKPQVCIASVMTMLGLAGLAAGQTKDSPQPQTRQPAEDHDRAMKERSEASDAKMDRVILVPSTRAEGVLVTGADGVRLGKVEDLVVRGRSGRVVYVLVSKGIMPADTEGPVRVVAIPFGAFSWDDERRVLAIPTTEEKFAAAVSFDADQWRDLSDPAKAAFAYKYFGVPEDRAVLDRRMHRAHRLSETPATDSRDGVRRTAPSTQDEPRRDSDGSLRVSREDEGSLFRVGKVRNRPLLTPEGRELGLVNDIVFDAPSGRIAFVVITPAPSMDAGDGRIAVPWPSFQVDPNGRLIAQELDKETLRASPRLTQAEWAELRIKGYTTDVYKRYGYEASDWNDSGAMSSSHGTEWRDKYRAAMTTGATRTIKGTVQSVDEEAAEGDTPRVVVLTVKTDDGDTVIVHTAPKTYLSEHKLALRPGDTVTIRGKTVEIDGKRCLCATEVVSADGKPVVLTDDDTR